MRESSFVVATPRMEFRMHPSCNFGILANNLYKVIILVLGPYSVYDTRRETPTNASIIIGYP